MGVALNFTAIDPIKALYWSAVINGVLAAPVMIIMMLLVRRKSVMGDLVVKGACLLAGMDFYSGDGPVHHRHGRVDEGLRNLVRK
jgi:Mn2+/Fe2+ NRAMP family transporter